MQLAVGLRFIEIVTRYSLTARFCRPSALALARFEQLPELYFHLWLRVLPSFALDRNIITEIQPPDAG